MLRPLLISLTYFCLQTWLGIPQAKSEELSMMDDAFDDQYIGCAENMDRTADEKIESEMSQFSLLWENARKRWNSVKTTISPSLPSNFKDEYGIAIVAYTNSTILYNGKTFSTIFNDAVSGAKRSQAASTNNFEFPYFHYYLTRALQCLKRDCDEMNKITVYRGTNFMYDGSGKMRFGRFASSSTNKKEAEKFGMVTVFTIHTCFGVNIQDISYNPKQKEVLIPVNEIFSVTKREGNNIILQSTKQNCSHFNCGKKNQMCVYNSGEKTQTCVSNSATRGGLAFPGELSLSLFGESIILVHAAALKLFAGF